MAHTGYIPGRFGWLWAIAIVVAIGLMALWIVSVVDEDEPGRRAEVEVTEGESGGGDELRGPEEAIDPVRLRQYVEWAEGQSPDSPVDDAFVVRGAQLLAAAVDDVLRGAEESAASQPEGEARGGGPAETAGLDVVELESYRQRADDSLRQVSDAGGGAQLAEAFQRAATDVSALLSELYQQVGAPELEEPVEDLLRIAQQIRPDRELYDQSEIVHRFFDQSASVMKRMSQIWSAHTPTIDEGAR